MFSGLTNIGNTCYMNSSLQALYATLPFRNYVIKLGCDKKRQLHWLLSELFCEMRSLNKNICPKDLKIAFGKQNRKFAGYNQEDAQEFISSLIEDLQKEVNGAEKRGKSQLPEPTSSAMAWEQYTKYYDKSYLVDLFVGQFNYATKCANGHFYDKWEQFWILSLAVSRTTDRIQKCMDESCADEQLTGIYCNQCKQAVSVTRRQTFSRLPFILIIQLKVFDNKLRKLTALGIKITEHLWINGIQFRLYACVCHHGGCIKGGHYTAYCRRNQNWYHFNDTAVSSVDNKNIFTQLSDDAYILFYNKMNSL